MPAQRKIFIFFLIASAIFLFFPKVALAQNLLQNPGFEELLFNWEASSGLNIAFNFTISSYVKKSGNYSALIKHSKTGSYGAQQIIRDIIGGNKYLGKGYLFFNNEKAKSARIRIAWYSSEDGSGSQMKTADSNIIDTTLPSWRELDTGVIEAPITARSAKFRILLASFEDAESSVYFDDLVFGEVTQPSPSPSPTSTAIITSISTPTPEPVSTTATYKINEVKDEDRETLSSVKVYVDGVYLHHYAPEELTFCNGCKCDTYVDCGFDEHTIKLEKDGYQDWSETTAINLGEAYEFDPVMQAEDIDSSVALTLTPTPTTKIASPTPTPKKVSLVATMSGEVLGEEGEEATTAFYPLEATGEAEETSEVTPSAKSASRRTWWPKVLLALGLIILFGTAFSLWYTQLR